ncbi:PIN/TRAM domain-containing protein [Chengkuizengella axinellae]|uniref:PIN/TRAM domain-containing protein n=1 Tax=Chengkuizengella axinellae TaxID=3064388 RepID=A0ABT9J762_9BACL|nr:PIN/TRAM domain-containing protein [Chengkuizengella sp. 2205SS18-9]MDP5276855.1 PIN/TRAM domain-containing protein [Chengkuizengella sp. 2205SS18-9]
MLKRLIQIGFVMIGGVIGYRFSSFFESLIGIETQQNSEYVVMGAGIVLFFLISLIAIFFYKIVIQKVEEKLARVPLSDLLSGIVGLIFGLLVSVMLYPAVSTINGMGNLVPIVFSIGLGYIGFKIGFSKKEEIRSIISKKEPAVGNGEQDDFNKGDHKILDTSVIIDGRIADICKTGFVEGILVIPEFVLEELQHIADSSDLLKRNRGRRGLDILNKIQKELDVKVLIYEGDFDEISEVDSKLVKLAKVLMGKVVTNDYNLNKVCELQGVSVLNINDLANAVKPVVLPGEEMLVQVIKDGKENGQGVAYLDDGTMIVVEGGSDFIGTNIEVLVTSVLQTSAGRMIFAKPKLLEKAL